MERVTLAGVGLELQRLGALRPGAPALVFLHEALGSVSLWRDFPKRLCEATGLPAVVYSRRGHGGSDPFGASPRTNAYLEDEAPVLRELLALEGVERPVLFGHSDGAAIALVYAAQWPVEALALEAPHVFVDREPEGVARVSASWPGTLREKLLRHHGANTDALFAAWADTWTSPAFQTWNIETYLDRISAPLLIIQGLDDPYTGLVQAERIEARVRGPHQRLELPQCGHSPHRDQPEQVLRDTAEFLARHLRR